MQQPNPPVSTHPSPKWRWFLRLFMGLAIVALLVTQRNGHQAWRALQTVSPAMLVAAVLFYLAGQFLSVVKWQLLLKAQGAYLPLRDCCRLYLVGMFWNLWMPTSIGGDAARAYLAGQLSGGKAIAASSILVERLTGFVALLTIGLFGFLFDILSHQQNHQGLSVIMSSVVLLLFFIVAATSLRLAAYRFESRAPHNKIVRKWASLHRALDLYAERRQRRTLLVSLLLSFIFQASQVLLNIGLASTVGLKIPWLSFWWLVPVLSAASLLPVGIGGLGVREAAAVGLLQGYGVSTGTVVAWSLLWQATVWLSSLPGGMWAFGIRAIANESS